jgi:tRNA-dihydrouridine synthase A
MAVQLGGNDPDLLGRAAYHCQAFGGYDEINLNCGCPSPKVSERCFGARLMLDPDRVRRIVSSMVRQATWTEVTVKCRIGADQRDTYEELVEFVHACKAGGARHLIVHARKCLLSGLSASQNRSVPPLHYEGAQKARHPRREGVS